MRLPPPSDATHFVFSSRARCAAGQLHCAAFKPNNRGLPPDRLRHLGRYALSYLLDGKGVYRDATGRCLHLQSGDCLLILPELGSTFGPLPGEHWSSFYMQFSGPIFDWWREHGLLDDARPVFQLRPVEQWLEKMQAVYAPVVAPDGSLASPDAAQIVTRLLVLLADIARFGTAPGKPDERPWWLWQAQHVLQNDLRAPLSLRAVASTLGVPVETFRKQFRAHVGIAPMQYRLQKRLDYAVRLLQHSELTAKEIAAQLGFPDEAHFSRLLSRHYGVSPRTLRRHGGVENDPT